MRVHTPQPAETIYRHTDALEVRQLNSPIITDHDMGNVTASVDECANLSSGFKR
jgi:hypothetical protein